MSYILKYLPTLESLKKQLRENPEKINYYKKYDAFIGSDEQISYINKMIQKNYKNK